jgi:hypothetical protein
MYQENLAYNASDIPACEDHLCPVCLTGHQQPQQTLIRRSTKPRSHLFPSKIRDAEFATDTVQYVATDSTGLTATSTRIILIEAPAATSTAQ